VVSFTPQPLDPGSHWIGGWVGAKVGLVAMVKKKDPFIDPAGNLV